MGAMPRYLLPNKVIDTFNRRPPNAVTKNSPKPLTLGDCANTKRLVRRKFATVAIQKLKVADKTIGRGVKQRRPKPPTSTTAAVPAVKK